MAVTQQDQTVLCSVRLLYILSWISQDHQRLLYVLSVVFSSPAPRSQQDQPGSPAPAPRSQLDSAEKLVTEKGEVHEKEEEVERLGETCSKVKEELGNKLEELMLLCYRKSAGR